MLHGHLQDVRHLLHDGHPRGLRGSCAPAAATAAVTASTAASCRLTSLTRGSGKRRAPKSTMELKR
eukprot:1911761-Lingulodinium_polyedra.AAC.1